MIISSIYKFCFFHIPKGAGTSISWNLVHHCAGFHRKEKHDSYSKAVEIYPEIKDYFTFAFVRNPFTRLVSWWNYLRTRPKKEKPSHGRIQLFLKRNPTFSHFIHSLKEPRLVNGGQSLYFQKPQFDYLSFNGKVAVNFVGKVDDIVEDWNKICDKFRWKHSELPWRKKNPVEVNDYQEYFDKELTKIVLSHFKKDFKEFGYGVL